MALFKISYFFPLYFLFSIGVINGQSTYDVQFSNWQKKDGLPSNIINDIIKDNLGFLWIATSDGLCRFDGPGQLKIYRNHQKESPENSLKSSNIIALFSDSHNNLWIGTRFGGLTRLHLPTNTWTTFQNVPNDPKSICNNEVLSILEDSKNRLWVGTEKGISLFDYQTETFTNFNNSIQDKSSIANKAVLTIIEDNQGWIWAGTWSGGLFLLVEEKSNGNKKQDFRNIKISLDKASNNIWSIYQDNDLRYWIGTHGGGLFLMNLPNIATNEIDRQDWEASFHNFSTENKETSNIGHNAIQAILQDMKGQLWVGTVYGLYVVDLSDFPKKFNSSSTNEKKDKLYLDFHQYLPVPYNSKALIGDNIMSIVEDNQDMIWIGTTNGLTQYNRYSNQFKNFSFDPTINKLPNTPNIYVDHQNHLWLAAGKNGLKKGKIKNKTIIFDEELGIDLPIQGKEISALYGYSKEWLYVGSHDGVTRIHLPTSRTNYYPTPKWVKKEIKDFFIKTIMVDNNQKIWLGTKVGLFTIDPQTTHYTHYEPDAHDPQSLSDQSINEIFQDTRGNIWLSTFNGLNLVKNNTDKRLKFETFYFDQLNPNNSLPANQITSFEEVEDQLFIGTLAGLCSFNFNNHKFEVYNKNNHKYWVQALEKSNDGTLWGSTTEGIFSFDVSTQTFQSYDSEDGLNIFPFGLGASSKAKDGTLIFANNKGFTYFNPPNLISNEKPPEVYITEIKKVNPKGEKILNAINQDKIKINHDDYRISFSIAALNYNRGDKNVFAYQLKGFENNWNYSNTSTPIVYTNLEPKAYTFIIKAANNNGVWNDKGTSIKVEKHPAFWETSWFKFLLVFGCILFMLFIFYLYTSNIRKRNLALRNYNESMNQEIKIRLAVEKDLKKKNIELSRSNEALEQFAYIASHDLQEPLRVVGSFSSLFASRYKDKLDQNGLEYLEFIQDGVVRISKLIRSLLSYSQLGKMDPTIKRIDLNKLLSIKLHDLSVLLEERNVEVIKKELPSIIGVEEQIGMVFHNLISNAIKFNQEEKPIVKISEVAKGNEDYWTFAITDNGIGIEPQYQKKIFEVFKRLHGKKEYKGTGIGLSIVKKIVNQHNGEIWIDSSLNEGSTFYFSISKKLDEEEEFQNMN